MAEFILKDWHNKEKTFNHDRIFVKGTDGELIQFSEGTGDAPAVVQPLEVTENGTYTAPDGVDGFNEVTVNVDPTKILLLKEQEFSGFSLDQKYGYVYYINNPGFAVSVGKEYTVVWDGVPWNVTAVDSDNFMPNSILLGNGAPAGLPGNGEPFAIGHMGNTVALLAFTDPKESHTVGIWERVAATSNDVRYVTFMSYDGTEEHGKKAVAVGDDCANPIERGIFEKPKQPANTPQYDYGAFLGWSDTLGGSVNKNALKSVTEDKIVYAAFEKFAILANGDCGESAFWRLNETGCLTISGVGAMTDNTNYNGSPWYEQYRNLITSVVIEDGITHIGDNSFYGVTSLTSITIPDSVTNIGNMAFGSCTALTSITIPNSVTSIGDRAFYGAGITSLNIPESVTSIGESAFCGIDITSITIPNSVTSIGDSLLSSCDKLTSVTLPDNITEINRDMFRSCTALTSITIPNSVTSIGGSSFYLSGIKSITIPEGVNHIGTYAFHGAKDLASAVFMDTSGWYVTMTKDATSGTSVTLTNTTTNATYLKSSYIQHYWYNPTA